MNKTTVPFSLRLTEQERADLARLAEREQRKAGDVLRVLLRQKLAETNKAQNCQKKARAA